MQVRPNQISAKRMRRLNAHEMGEKEQKTMKAAENILFMAIVATLGMLMVAAMIYFSEVTG